MSKISKGDIYYLFEDLWPMMLYAHDHKRNCIAQFKAIENYFVKYPQNTDHNILLNSLRTLDGIGITIASGLIWSAHRIERVPFDKYTLTYSLEKRILQTDKISNDYIGACERVKEYCDGY